MFDFYLQMASLLVVALLFGGMFLFSAGFAAFLFKYLPAQEARMLIRQAFPLFYVFVIAASGLATVLSWGHDQFNATAMALVMLSAVAARQLLMPAINRASDLALRNRFVWLHGFSVLLTLGHIALAGVVLVHMVP